MSRVNLFLLGSPHIDREGAPIEVDTRKAIALLTYLAVTGESHGRDALAALFWPEVDQARAHAALRRTLSTLNKALAGCGLSIDRETVSLDRSPDVWIDVDQFHHRLAACLTHGHPATETCPVCLIPLTEAAHLYRGDFLSGFTLRDSPGFDDWQFFQTEGMRRELAGALERLVRWYSAQGEFEPAIAHARRWLALDALHEPAHRHLMQLYAWADQRAAALRQYRECVRVLDQELGVAPLEETTRLYEAIKENRLAAEVPSPESPAALAGPPPLPESPALEFPLSTPLVGRAAEWETLLQVYDSMRSEGHWVILEGEAGIGKTRLAEALLQHLRGRGATTMMARCYEGEVHLAYGPFVEALRAVVQQPKGADKLQALPAHWRVEASRLLPELADWPPGLGTLSPLEGPGAQSRFFEGMAQVLSTLMDGSLPGLLFFDDLQWADEASVDLLAYLVRRLRAWPVCLLVTWRGEHLPDRLRHLLAEAKRAGTLTLVPLSRLSLSAVTELVQSSLSHWGGSLKVSDPTPERLAERLYRESEGSPFFLVEYLVALASGADVTADLPLPSSVRELLASRLSAVSETGWQLLSAAAAIGRSFDFDTLQVASGRSEEEAVTGLEALMAQGLVREVRGNGGAGALNYDFSHEKLRALVYEETSLARRRLLHRRVAEALRGRARAQGRVQLGALAGQIAEHYRLGGLEAEAAEYFKLAGEHTRALYANAEALAQFRAALALGHPDTAALHEAIGDLHTLAGDYVAALTSYEAAAARCAPEALAGLEHKLGNIYHRRGEWKLAESHFEAAFNALGEQGPTGARARLYADWSLTAHHRGEAERSLALAQRALELAEAADDRQALAQAHNILGVLLSSQRDLEQARDHLERSLALAESLNDPNARVAALNNLALAFSRNGDAAQALRLTQQALALCVSLGDRHREAALHNNLADLLHAGGRAEEAMAHLKQAVSLFAEIGREAGGWQPEIWKLTEW